MSGDDTALYRDALETLLARNQDDRAAWDALLDGGWLGSVPEADATWPLARAALATVAAVAAAGRSLPVVGHLAAVSGFAEAEDERVGVDAAAIVVDISVDDAGHARGRLLGPAAADAIVVCDGERSFWAEPTGVSVEPDPIAIFAEIGVAAARIESGALTPLDISPRRQESRLAGLLAADAIAAVSSATDRTIDYLKHREQFGQPLGAFQALQHRAVDMHAACLMGRALLDRLTEAWIEGDGDGAWSCKAFGGERLTWASGEAIQLHGGIGFTWELGLHLAMRRAQAARILLGGMARAGAEVIRVVGDDRVPGLRDWSL